MTITATVMMALVFLAQPGQEGRQEKRVELSCKKMEIFNKEGKVVCTGRVVMRKEDSIMTCERMEADYDKEGGIDQAVCRGNVRFVVKRGMKKLGEAEETREAGGDTAYYRSMPERIELEGSPWIRQGGSVLKGKKILYFPKEDRMVVEKARGNLVVKDKVLEKER